MSYICAFQRRIYDILLQKIVSEYFLYLVTIAYLRLRLGEEFFPFKKDGATRGASACAARATSTIIQSAILMDS